VDPDAIAAIAAMWKDYEYKELSCFICDAPACRPIFSQIRHGEVAPRPVIARTTIEFADATTSLLARTTWWAAPITV
jgi:hypothetical protein